MFKLLRLYFFILIFFATAIQADDFTARLLESERLAKKWFLSSVNESGLFNYQYAPSHDVYDTGNNEIRQIMASRLLAEYASSDPSLLPLHKKNMEFLTRNWLKFTGNYAYISFQGKSKLGVNAMFLRTLVASPFFEENRLLAEKIEKSILACIRTDGSMRAFLVEPNYKYEEDYLLTFYSGEALVALIEYYEKIKEVSLLNLIIKSQDYYLQKYVVELSQNYYPAYVPWHTISLNKLFKITGNKKYADAIFILNDKLLEIQDRLRHVGRFYDRTTPRYGSPHASSDGVYTEGLVYAYEIAQQVQDEFHQTVYEEAIKIAFGNLMSLQYLPQNSSNLPVPARAIGAFRIMKPEPDSSFAEQRGANIRIDSVQHTLDAMIKYNAVRQKVNNIK